MRGDWDDFEFSNPDYNVRRSAYAEAPAVTGDRPGVLPVTMPAGWADDHDWGVRRIRTHLGAPLGPRAEARVLGLSFDSAATIVMLGLGSYGAFQLANRRTALGLASLGASALTYGAVRAVRNFPGI